MERSYFAPSAGRYRVIVVEDADRMVERTSNVLLKALEEPPEQTVWILCAPSEADLLPTIRSRVRSLRLREPDVADVARLITLRTGADEAVAEQAARHSQRHIGMAQRLATDDAARRRRDETLRSVIGVRGVGDAVDVAGRIIQAATEDAKALTAERDAQERASLLRTIGIAEGQAVPPALRTQLSALEDDQKKRATRSLRDGIDRVLTDLQSLFRDVIMLQFGRGDDLINGELRPELEGLASAWPEARTLVVLDHLAETRQSLERNVAPLLALESLLVTITSGKETVNNRSTSRFRRAAAVIAGLAAASVALSGCLYAMIPEQSSRPATTIVPDTDGVAEDLLPFYSQELEWTDCGPGFDCTEVTAPLDWENPGAGDISLSVIRHRAQGTPVGSLLTNPGWSRIERCGARPEQPRLRGGT